MKTQIAFITAAIFLAGCSSVSEKIPTVKIEKRKPKTTVQSASFVQAVPTKIASASQKEAAAVCETDAMRNQVVDGDDSNDSVRIMVVQDSSASSQLLSEVEVNCRDYFLRKSLQSSKPVIIQSSTTAVGTPVLTSRQNSSFTYIVQRGDTVWDIARQHCTSVKAISNLNGLGRAHNIDIGQRLRMPIQDCD
jgi:LysM repeat protein